MRMVRIAEPNIQSHIQMPKCMLKRFENEHKRFYYYDVEQGFIGSNGHAKSINTSHGYYSQKTETFLRDYIETPFSNLLSQIDRIDFDSIPFSMPLDLDVLVKRFINALISRSPQMISETKKNSLFYQFLSVQSQHDYAAEKGIELAEQFNFFRDFFVTFAVNKTTVPFILPMCGLYNFKFNGIDTVFLPVSPQLCIALVNNDGADLFIRDGVGAMILVSDDSQATWFNKRALSSQKHAGCGYVVSPDKTSLEMCMEPVCCK